MHVENRIDVLELCLCTRSGRHFVGMDSGVNLISNVIQLHTHPKENGNKYSLSLDRPFSNSIFQIHW